MLRFSIVAVSGVFRPNPGPKDRERFHISQLSPLVLQVIFLEKRVTELEKDTAANGEQHSRLKQENLQLVHR